MIQRMYNDTRTPETPGQKPEKDHVCKMIRMPRHVADVDTGAHPDLGVLLMEIKEESESLLRLMEQHQSQISIDR
jgi:hypothetical protein